MYATSDRPFAAPQTSSASAPRLASFSTSTGSPSRLAGLRRSVDPDPAGQDGGGLHRPGSAIDRRRQAHADADHPLPINARLVEDPLDELGGSVEALIGGVVDIHLAPGLGEHRVREIGDGDPQMTMAEVQPDRQARRSVERDHDRRPAGMRLARGLTVTLTGEAGLEQVGDDRGDRRSREPGHPGQLGPARQATLAQSIDDALAVALPQRCQRAASPPHSARIHSHAALFVKS